MSVYQAFFQMLHSSNLNELADRLEVFIEKLSVLNDKQSILDELCRALSIKCFYGKIPIDDFLLIYDEENSLPEFLYNHWTFCDTAEENIDNLILIIKNIRDQFVPPKAARISDQVIHELINIVEQKYQFGTNILNRHPIKILKINQTHKKYGCYYIAGISDRGIEKDAIVMSCPHNDGLYQEFGFMHELGHRLHTTLTHQTFVPPESFAWYSTYWGQPKTKEHDKHNQILSEHFADAFAIAALHGTPYEKCIPYDTPVEIVAIYDLYMRISIRTLDGKIIHSLSDLPKKAKELGIWRDDSSK